MTLSSSPATYSSTSSTLIGLDSTSVRNERPSRVLAKRAWKVPVHNPETTSFHYRFIYLSNITSITMAAMYWIRQSRWNKHVIEKKTLKSKETYQCLKQALMSPPSLNWLSNHCHSTGNTEELVRKYAFCNQFGQAADCTVLLTKRCANDQYQQSSQGLPRSRRHWLLMMSATSVYLNGGLLHFRLWLGSFSKTPSLYVCSLMNSGATSETLKLIVYTVVKKRNQGSQGNTWSCQMAYLSCGGKRRWQKGEAHKLPAKNIKWQW